MSDRETFWAKIKAEPDNHQVRLVFADWLDENGETELGFALRWSGFRHKFPEVTERRKWAKWERGRLDKDGSMTDEGRLIQHIHLATGAVTFSRTTMNMLPIPVFDLIPKGEKLFDRVPNGGHRTVEAAFEALAFALKRLRVSLDFTPAG